MLGIDMLDAHSTNRRDVAELREQIRKRPADLRTQRPHGGADLPGVQSKVLSEACCRLQAVLILDRLRRQAMLRRYSLMSAKAEGLPRVIGAFLAVPNDFILSSLYSTTGMPLSSSHRCARTPGGGVHTLHPGEALLACNRPASQADGGMIDDGVLIPLCGQVTMRNESPPFHGRGEPSPKRQLGRQRARS